MVQVLGRDDTLYWPCFQPNSRHCGWGLLVYESSPQGKIIVEYPKGS